MKKVGAVLLTLFLVVFGLPFSVVSSACDVGKSLSTSASLCVETKENKGAVKNNNEQLINNSKKTNKDAEKAINEAESSENKNKNNKKVNNSKKEDKSKGVSKSAKKANNESEKIKNESKDANKSASKASKNGQKLVYVNSKKRKNNESGDSSKESKIQNVIIFIVRFRKVIQSGVTAIAMFIASKFPGIKDVNAKIKEFLNNKLNMNEKLAEFSAMLSSTGIPAAIAALF